MLSVISPSLLIWHLALLGNSEGEQKESMHGSLSEHELSDKDDRSYSDGKPGADDDDRSSGMEESVKEESPLENKEFEDEPGTPQDSRGSDEEISSSHEKPQPDVSTEKSNDAERSDSQGSLGDDADSHSTDRGDSERSSATKSDELSDDELLVMLILIHYLMKTYISWWTIMW